MVVSHQPRRRKDGRLICGRGCGVGQGTITPRRDAAVCKGEKDFYPQVLYR